MLLYFVNNQGNACCTKLLQYCISKELINKKDLRKFFLIENYFKNFRKSFFIGMRRKGDFWRTCRHSLWESGLVIFFKRIFKSWFLRFCEFSKLQSLSRTKIVFQFPKFINWKYSGNKNEMWWIFWMKWKKILKIFFIAFFSLWNLTKIL